MADTGQKDIRRIAIQAFAAPIGGCGYYEGYVNFAGKPLFQASPSASSGVGFVEVRPNGVCGRTFPGVSFAPDPNGASHYRAIAVVRCPRPISK